MTYQDDIDQTLLEQYLNENIKNGKANFLFEESFLETLLQNGKYELVVSCLEKGFIIVDQEDIYTDLSNSGSVLIYQYMRNQVPDLCDYSKWAHNAARDGKLDVIQWIMQVEPGIITANFSALSLLALYNDHPEINNVIQRFLEVNSLIRRGYPLVDGLLIRNETSEPAANYIKRIPLDEMNLLLDRVKRGVFMIIEIENVRLDHRGSLYDTDVLDTPILDNFFDLYIVS